MSFLNRLVAVEPDELRPMLWAALYNFLLLAAYFVIRPVRDEMGIAGGVRNLPWLFLGTLLGMLLVHPLFSALVGRLPRRLFVPLSYGFFVVNLLVFWVLFLTLPAASGIWTGRVFFIWTSVFNLFVVSIFWSVMADLFRPEQAKRLFGFVAVGGTVGAAVGSGSTAFLASRVTPTNLLVLSAVLLGLAMLAAHNLMRSSALAEARREVPIADAGAAVGGRILDGVRAAFSSPYLIGIVGYMLLYTITSTFLYFQQAGIVDTSLTALIQIFFTGRIVRRIGVALSLATLPLVSLLGFGAVGVWPTLTAIAVVQVLRRTSNYAIARPCREMLYTVVSRDSKYKAKNFIDTFVYRFGDQVGAWTSGLLMLVGLGGALISVVAAPLAAVWLALGLWLGHRQAAMATTGPGNPAAPRTTPDPG
jgi:AAA family ATP:ADP antiporter